MLSKKTKYGIKALAFIARQEGNKPVQQPRLPEVRIFRISSWRAFCCF